MVFGPGSWGAVIGVLGAGCGILEPGSWVSRLDPGWILGVASRILDPRKMGTLPKMDTLGTETWASPAHDTQ